MRPAVLHLIGSFHTGGSERQAVQLLARLAATGGYDLRVAVLDPRGELRQEVERLEAGPVEEYPLRRFYDLVAAKQTMRFARALRRARIEILHTHDFYTNVFGLVGGSLARVPVRIASRREIDGVRTPAQKRVERAVYRLAHAVVANSRAVRAALVAEGVSPAKIHVVHNGLDLARFPLSSEADGADARAAFGIPRDAPLVSIVANLRLAVKDHPTFLRAARWILDRVPDAHFAVAGEGDLLPDMRRLAAEAGLGRSVHFLGRCDRVSALIAASHVCVLSSRSEGFSNAILEYMGGARAVVATDVGGAREAVEEGVTGYLVPPGDHDAMAERVVRLLLDPGRARQMGLEGKRAVGERFSCEAQLRRIETLYSRLARGNADS